MKLNAVWHYLSPAENFAFALHLNEDSSAVDKRLKSLYCDILYIVIRFYET